LYFCEQYRYPALARSAFTLEIDMIKPPTTLTRRSVCRAGAELVVAATATRLLTPVSAQAEGAHQAGAEALNGDGFYRSGLASSRRP
jgi:hypothetical protein